MWYCVCVYMCMHMCMCMSMYVCVYVCVCVCLLFVCVYVRLQQIGYVFILYPYCHMAHITILNPVLQVVPFPSCAIGQHWAPGCQHPQALHPHALPHQPHLLPHPQPLPSPADHMLWRRHDQGLGPYHLHAGNITV